MFSNIYTSECSIDVTRDILMYVVRAGRATRADNDDDVSNKRILEMIRNAVSNHDQIHRRMR